MATRKSENGSEPTNQRPLLLHLSHANNASNQDFLRLLNQVREQFGTAALARHIFQEISSRNIPFFLPISMGIHEPASEAQVMHFIARAIETDFDTALQELQTAVDEQRSSLLQNAEFDTIGGVSFDDAVQDMDFQFEDLGFDQDQLEMKILSTEPDPIMNTMTAFILDPSHAHSYANTILRHLIDEVRGQFGLETIAQHVFQALTSHGITMFLPIPHGTSLGVFEPASTEAVLHFIRRTLEIGFEAALEEITTATENLMAEDESVFSLDLNFDFDGNGGDLEDLL